LSIVVDDSGNLVGGGSGEDFELKGEVEIDTDGDGTPEQFSGILLSGEVEKFGFEDREVDDRYDFVFTTTGGELAGLFGSAFGVTTVSEHSSFDGSFVSDFGGGAKGSVCRISRAAIGDRVWRDDDSDGIQDTGESGISGVTVELYSDVDGDGEAEPGTDDNGPVDSTTTDGSGNYLFSDLAPGDYFVKFLAPPLLDFSPRDQGPDDALDSDADTATGQTVCTTLESGETDRRWDAGLVLQADIDVEKFVAVVPLGELEGLTPG
jgi:hypothetical protein